MPVNERALIDACPLDIDSPDLGSRSPEAEVGNLTQVNEPNPVGGADYVTSYGYDVLNRLRTVSMPRPTGTQTRAFTYTGALLTSVTNPENGTVTNYYNLDNSLNYKVDAKGQAIVYGHNGYKRVIQIAKYPSGYTPGGTNYEDVCQRVTYNYDSNPDTTYPSYTQYIAGRLASVHYAGAGCQTYNGTLTSSYTGNNTSRCMRTRRLGKCCARRCGCGRRCIPARTVRRRTWRQIS